MPARQKFETALVITGDGSGGTKAVRLTREQLTKLSKEGKKTTRSVKSMNNQLSGMRSKLSALSPIVGLFGAGLAALGLGSLASELFESAVATDKMRAMLKTATGDIDKAGVAFDRLVSFAKTTPFTLDQSVNGFIKLKNLGLDPSERAMTSFGNTSAAMGKSLEQMIEAVADASTNEFERLKEFGIKAKQEKDTVTFTFQGVETTVKKNSDAIQGYLIGLGETKFAGAMADQMNSLGGKVSNMKDSFGALFRQIGDIGATDIFKRAIQGIIDITGSVTIGIVELTTTWAFFIDDLKYGDGVFKIVRDGFNQLKSAVESVKNILAPFSEQFETMGKVAGGAIAAILAGKAVWALTAGGIGLIVVAVKALTRALFGNPIVLAITAIALSAKLIYDHWDGIKKFFIELWSSVKDRFNKGVDFVKKILTNFTPAGLVYKHWSKIANYFQKMWSGIKTGFKKGVDFVKYALKNFTAVGLVYKHWSKITRFFSDLWKKITASTKALSRTVSKLWSALWSGVKTIATRLTSAVLSVIKKLWSDLKASPKAAWDAIKSGWSSLWTGIKTTSITLSSAVLSVIKKLWVDIKESPKAAWDAVKSGWSGLWKALKSILSGAKTKLISAVKDLWKGMLDTFRNIPAKFKNFGKNIADGIKDGIKSKLQSVKNTMSNMADSVANIFKKKHEIQSPSKLFKRFGGWIMDGLKTGIADGKQRVESSFDGLFSGVQSGFDDFTNKANKTIIDGFSKAAEGGFSSFEDLAANLKKLFKDLVLKPVIKPITTAISGVLNGTGSGNILGDLKKGVLGMYTSSGGLGGAIQSYATGSSMSQMFGGSEASQIGGGLGTAIGAAFGPVGSAIGNALGSLVGGLFDGDDSGAHYGSKGQAAVNGIGLAAPEVTSKFGRFALLEDGTREYEFEAQALPALQSLAKIEDAIASFIPDSDIAKIKTRLDAFETNDRSFAEVSRQRLGIIFSEIDSDIASLIDMSKPLKEVGEQINAVAIANQLLVPTLKNFGFNLGKTQKQAIKAAMGLAKNAGGIEALSTAYDNYAQKILSAETKLNDSRNTAIGTVTDFNKALGLSGSSAITTKTQLESYVESLKTSGAAQTDLGQQHLVAALQAVDAIDLLVQTQAPINDLVATITQFLPESEVTRVTAALESLNNSTGVVDASIREQLITAFDALTVSLVDTTLPTSELIAQVQKITEAATIAVPAFENLGLNLGDNEAKAIATAMGLTELAGGFDAFMGTFQNYIQTVYSEQEQLQVKQAQAANELQGLNNQLGLTGEAAIDTIPELRAYVDSLNKSGAIQTELGQTNLLAALESANAVKIVADSGLSLNEIMTTLPQNILDVATTLDPVAEASDAVTKATQATTESLTTLSSDFTDLSTQSDIVSKSVDKANSTIEILSKSVDISSDAANDASDKITDLSKNTDILTNAVDENANATKELKDANVLTSTSIDQTVEALKDQSTINALLSKSASLTSKSLLLVSDDFGRLTGVGQLLSASIKSTSAEALNLANAGGTAASGMGVAENALNSLASTARSVFAEISNIQAASRSAFSAIESIKSSAEASARAANLALEKAANDNADARAYAAETSRNLEQAKRDKQNSTAIVDELRTVKNEISRLRDESAKSARIDQNQREQGNRDRVTQTEQYKESARQKESFVKKSAVI